MIMSETAGLEDYGAQLRDAVVEVHKRKAGSEHRILKERGRRCRRQAILAAQMQERSNQCPKRKSQKWCSCSISCSGFFLPTTATGRAAVYDNGNGGHCLVGALLQSTQVLGFNRHTATGVLIATLAFLEARDSGRRSAA
jgi:hypothetical protein